MKSIRINRIFSFTGLIFSSLICVSCASVPGTQSNSLGTQSTYVSPQRSFQVKVPYLLDQYNERQYMKILSYSPPGGGEAVDFALDQSYWMGYGGLYMIVWSPCWTILPKGAACPISDRFFYKITRSTPYRDLKYDLAGSRMHIVSIKKLRINGHAAYQYIARGIWEHINATVIGTYINFNTAVAMVYLIQNQTFPINWHRYDQFRRSIKPL